MPAEWLRLHSLTSRLMNRVTGKRIVAVDVDSGVNVLDYFQSAEIIVIDLGANMLDRAGWRTQFSLRSEIFVNC